MSQKRSPTVATVISTTSRPRVLPNPLSHRRRAPAAPHPMAATVRDVPTAGVEVYRSSFARRSAAMSMPDEALISQPGICGVLASSHRPGGRLLITSRT